MDARIIVVFALALGMILASGCLSIGKTTVILPHSNQSVELDIIDQATGQGSYINAERKDAKMQISYHESSWWSSGGGYSDKTIIYSDDKIAYRYDDHFGNTGRRITVNCTRGDCGFGFLLKRDYHKRYPGPQDLNYLWLICNNDGTYSMKWTMSGAEDKKESKTGRGCPDCESGGCGECTEFNLTCIKQAG
jgi:hypothetical protein